MSAQRERLILTIDKSKKKAFLEMLKLFDFVQVEAPEAVVEGFIRRAPKKSVLSEEDVINEVMEHRYGKRQR